MQTKKFMGADMMLDRLTAQMGGNRELAVKTLIARGHLQEDGKTWTEEGAKRNAMTAEERAIDRAQKKYGGSAAQYRYNPDTNTAKRLTVGWKSRKPK